MILRLFDFPIKAARIHIKISVELMSIMSKFLYFKFSAHLITNTRPFLSVLTLYHQDEPWKARCARARQALDLRHSPQAPLQS